MLRRVIKYQVEALTSRNSDQVLADRVAELTKAHERLSVFVKQVAAFNYDGELVDGEAFLMENDDAVDTLNALIHEARKVVEIENGPHQTPLSHRQF